MRSNTFVRGLVCAAAALILAAAPAAAAPAPNKVGELEPLQLASPSPYGKAFGADAREFVVRHPGATYIRVHFSKFDLAPGDWVTIASADGGESFTYTGRGPHSTGEFWAQAILGDTAIVRLQATVGGEGGFEIDAFGRGIVDLVGERPSDPSPESVCGTQDWKDAACYASGTYTTEYEKSRAAVLALIGCCSSCTAFKVSDSGQFLTNNHCTASTSGVQSTELRFMYQTPGCATGTAGYTGSVMGSQLVRTDATLDYTLMTTTGDATSIPCLTLENRLPAVGERIYIAGHPGGGPKKLSIESASNTGGLCRVDAAPYAGNSATSDVGYYCDTAGGSSGSPVLSGETHQVIALHHFGGCLNSGGRSDLILGQIGSDIQTCSSGGGGENCGNGVVDAGEQCDGSDLGGETCESRGFPGGTLSCTSSCTFNTSACTPACAPFNAPCRRGTDCCSGLCLGKGKNKACR
ncbi:MAG TPA: serine protease [Candidatus Polarisedimenticolaceae bacterium]